MKIRNRFIANLLAVVLAVSSIQFPTLDVQAQELYQETDSKSSSEDTDGQEETSDAEENSGQEEERVEEDNEQQEETAPEEGDSTKEESEDQETADENVSDKDMENEDLGEESQDEEDTEDVKETEEAIDQAVEQTASLNAMFATDYIAYDTDLTDDITWSIDKNGKLIVEGTGDFNRVSISEFSYYPPWYDYILDITSAEINVTGMTDASYMFFCCSYLEEVDLTNFDTGSVTNMNNMFSNCDNLTSLDLSNFDTHNVTDMKGMFALCWELSDIKFGTFFDTENVTDMAIMFIGCKSLTDLDLSHFNTEKVTDMSSMFEGCSGLTSLDLSNFDVSLAPDMEDFFTGCTALSEIHTPRNVQTYVGLPKADIEDIWYQYDRTGIKTVLSLPRNLNESANLIKNEKPDIKGPYIEAVKDKIEYKNNETINTDDITIIYYDAAGGRTEDKNEENYTTNAEELDTSEPGPVILTVTYTEPDTDTQLETEIELTIKVPTRIVVYMDKTVYLLNEMINTDDLSVFYYDDLGNPNWIRDFTTNASEIDMSTTGTKTLKVTYIDPVTGEELTAELEFTVTDDIALGNTYSITWRIDKNGKLMLEGEGDYPHTSSSVVPWSKYASEIKSAQISVEGMTNASYMFYGCSNLTEVDFSDFDTSNITDMRYMFYGCESLTEIDVSNFRTDKVTNMSWMFSGCSSLSFIDVSSFNTSNVTDMSDMFSDCISLTVLDLSKFNLGKIEVLIAYTDWLATGVTNLVAGCKNLNTIFAPINLPGFTDEDWSSLYTDGGVTDWYRGDTNAVIHWLPTGLKSSIVITKGAVPDKSVHIAAYKQRTVYFPGEEINVDDISVIYYENKTGGQVQKITSGYTTNIEDIDPSKIGKQTLTVTYENLTTEVDIYIYYSITGSNIEITIPDTCIYNKSAQRPAVEIVHHLGDEDIMLTAGEDYTVSYENNIEAGNSAIVYVKGTGDYYGTVKRNFVIEKAKAPEDEVTIVFVKPSDEVQTYRISGIFSGYGTQTEYKVGTPIEDDTIEGNVMLGTPEISTIGNISYVSYYVNIDGAAGDFVTIPVTVSFKNYNDATYTIKIILRDKDDNYIAVGQSNDIIWTIDENGKLVITGTGNVSGTPWGSYATSIKSAEVNVTGMTKATSLFSGCSKMTDVDLSNFNTDSLESMSRMFYNCQALTGVDLSNHDLSKVTDMSYMFWQCSSLTNVNLSNTNACNVKNLAYMFYHCEKLTSLNMSGFNAVAVENMNNTFFYCNSLTMLDLSCFDLSNDPYDVYSLFNYTPELTTIYTPKNLNIRVNLPMKSSEVWYQVDGSSITYLPQQLNYSIVIERNQKPKVTAGLTAQKTKTVYVCGETINTDDITLIRFSDNGVVETITDFTTNAAEIDVTTPGKRELVITYIDPKTMTNKNPEGVKETTTIELSITLALTQENVTITLPDESGISYNGYAQKPLPIVTVHIEGKDEVDETESILALNTDYTLSYENNINAGENAVVIVTGTGVYSGTAKKDFTINRANLIITASDLFIELGDSLPKSTDYTYRVDGLAAGDELIKEPSLTCAITDTSVLGTYPIVPSGADAGSNYEITYRNGTLTVAEERVVYTVSFDLLGHGTDIDPITGIKAGSLIEAPESLTEGDIVLEKIPGENGGDSTKTYIFTGWYKDKTFAVKQKWNFDTDTVQGDITLYACWLAAATGADGQGANLSIQEIADQNYTGNAIKPNVLVYSGDGRTLLKSGKDYTIKYYNNTVADTEEEKEKGGIGSSENDSSNGFTSDMAYVVITGKGNYQGTIYRNFRILPASVSAEDEDGNVTLSSGFTLKYTEQLVKNTSKAQKPFTSLKYKKAMKAGTDYDVALTALTAYDADGKPAQNEDGSVWTVTGNAADKYIPAIPKGYYGTFIMTVTGKGNYTGSFTKKILVAEKNQLMKNASITLGKKQKSLSYTEAEGKDIILSPGYYDTDKKQYYKINLDGSISNDPEPNTNEIFTVKAGGKYLVYGSDYTVRYTNNNAVGTATMTVTGMGEYMGSKSVTFKITGTAFSTKTIEVKADDKENPDGNDWKASMSYTGKALTQNKVTLTPKANPEEKLVYGTHYTISYKNNLKKGTATMTFTAKPESGYSGSFNKTYKITPQSLLYVTFDENSVSPNEQNEQKNTKTLTWSGETPAYSPNGATLRFTLKNEEGIALKQGTDYTVSYQNNKVVTEGNINKMPTMTIKGKGNYAGTLTVTFLIQKANIKTALENGSLTISASAAAWKENMKFKDLKLKVLDGKKALSEGEGKDYILEGCTDADIQAYADDLKQKTETGKEMTAKEPTVTIKGTETNYTDKAEISLVDYIYVTRLTSKNLKIEVTGDTTYIGSDVKIEPSVKVTYYPNNDAGKPDAVADPTFTDADYIVTYGANNAAGKNKGSVTVTGTGIYGGSVTAKFTIQSKNVYTVIN